ncbi:DUF6261 family protein [Thermophagus sp. OGC60D27]|uniref:DUF6261 family protein n=1 Tax=Thermophagus sp. OGC60D27 TaxID=3458415 RepID=UPI004037E251
MFIAALIHNFRNSEFVQFIKNILNIVGSHDPELLNVKNVYDDLSALSSQISELYKPETGSDITQEIQELDERRDRAFTGIYRFIDAFSYHFDAEKREAATRLYDAILLFGGGVARLNYQAETSTIAGIINKFRTDTDLVEAVAKIEGLAEWLNEMEEANKLFDEAYLKRVKEEAAKPEVRMADLRKEIIGVYRALLQHLEANAIVSGNDSYQQVAKEINEVIEKYNRVVETRSSTSGTKEEVDQ